MNKTIISKDVQRYLKGVYEQGYNFEMFLTAVVVNRDKNKASYGSNLYNFVKYTEYLTLFEVVEVLKGEYEVEYDKEDQITNAYKKYKKIAKISQVTSNRNQAIGFIKAIDLMNILYKLNLDLEGE